MTEAIPIKIPNEASKVRVLCARSAVTAIENEGNKFHDNFQERMDSSGLIKAALRAG